MNETLCKQIFIHKICFMCSNVNYVSNYKSLTFVLSFLSFFVHTHLFTRWLILEFMLWAPPQLLVLWRTPPCGVVIHFVLLFCGRTPPILEYYWETNVLVILERTPLVFLFYVIWLIMMHSILFLWRWFSHCVASMDCSYFWWSLRGLLSCYFWGYTHLNAFSFSDKIIQRWTLF